MLPKAAVADSDRFETNVSAKWRQAPRLGPLEHAIIGLHDFRSFRHGSHQLAAVTLGLPATESKVLHLPELHDLARMRYANT